MSRKLLHPCTQPPCECRAECERHGCFREAMREVAAREKYGSWQAMNTGPFYAVRASSHPSPHDRALTALRWASGIAFVAFLLWLVSFT